MNPSSPTPGDWGRAGCEGQVETTPEKHPHSRANPPRHKHSHTHMQASACACTRTCMHQACPPPLPPTGFTHLPPQTFSFPHTHLRTQVPSVTLHILRMSRNFPSTSCQTHANPHMLISTGFAHTYACTPYLGSHIWGKKEATGTNMHACHLHRRQAPHTPACTPMYIHTCVNLCPYSGIRTQVFSRLKNTDFENVCVSGYTLPSPSLHMPTGLHTHAALPTDRGSCPHSPPTYHLLLQSRIFPHRNPLSTCTPTCLTSDMSTP